MNDFFFDEPGFAVVSTEVKPVENLFGPKPVLFYDDGFAEATPAIQLPDDASQKQPGILSPEEVCEFIRKEATKNILEMRKVLAVFNEKYPPICWQHGFLLVGTQCGEPDCQYCPHSLGWRSYDYTHTAKEIAYAKKHEIKLKPKSYKGVILPLDAPKPEFMWTEKRYKSLPPVFWREDMLNQDMAEAFRKFENARIILNERRKKISSIFDYFKYAAMASTSEIFKKDLPFTI